MATQSLTSAPARPATMAALLARAERHDGVAVRFRRDGALHEWSHAELGERVRALALGFAGLGIRPGDAIAILAGTRPEWTLADCAALRAGATVVPIYHTSSPEQCRYVLAHSGARTVVCEDAAQLAKVEAIRDGCPELEHALTIEPAGGVPSLADLARPGDPAALEAIAADTSPDDVATIVYTSGTTGPPKGCLLTHANLLATSEMYTAELALRPPIRIFLFLPLAHVLARMTQIVALDVGGTLAYWSGDAAQVLDDIAQLRPTHLPSVPRVFEKIHARATDDASAARERALRAALAIGRRARAAQRHGPARPALRAAHALADRLVLSRIRGLFGAELQMALSGAAPIGAEILRFFDACGVPVYEGYGLTETCAAGTLNSARGFRFGTVGRALPGTDVAVAADGEVLLRGPNVFRGYHRDEAATRATFTGEWLRTGDLGELDAEGFLRITGRKKDLIITSSGKNVSPAEIETALRESRWISQAVVYGDRRPYLVALLTLDPEEAPELARRLDIVPADIAAMAYDRRVLEVLRQEVDGVNARFARIEQVKRFTVLPHDLSQDAGELTPTLKVRRATVYDRYREDLAALYA